METWSASPNSTSKNRAALEEEPVRTSSTRRPIDCAYMRASVAREPLSRCNRDRARAISLSSFSPFSLLSFTRSSPYPENIRCEASGTGRCQIPITRFDELGGNPPFDEFAPYLTTYQLPLPSTRIITRFYRSLPLPNIAN